MLKFHNMENYFQFYVMVIEGLFVYPVKSLPPVSVDYIAGSPFGMTNDRKFILLDAAGKMMTQRNTDLMNLFELALTNEGIQVYSKILGASLLLENDKECGDVVEFKVWDRPGRGVGYSNQADDFFSSHFNSKTRCLVTSTEGSHISFHDSAPLLLANKTTLESIAKAMHRTIDVMRFRPNIVVSAALAMEELNWRIVHINQTQFESIKLSSRCVIINRNPLTDVRDETLLHDLRPFLLRDNKLKFGLYLQPEGNYSLRTGQHVATEL